MQWCEFLSACSATSHWLECQGTWGWEADAVPCIQVLQWLPDCRNLHTGLRCASWTPLLLRGGWDHHLSVRVPAEMTMALRYFPVKRWWWWIDGNRSSAIRVKSRRNSNAKSTSANATENPGVTWNTRGTTRWTALREGLLTSGFFQASGC